MGVWKDKAQDVIVVILGGGRGARLDPLTRLRSKPAVPFAGKYRLIDIPISNALHSGMERMFVLTQFNSASLHRHIVRTYKFDVFSRGFVQILAAQQTTTEERWFQGTADAVRRNLRFIADLRGDLVLILSGDHMYRMDYRDMLREHLERDAEITLATLPSSEQAIEDFGAVRVDETGRVVEFREKPRTAEARAGMEVAPALLERYGIESDRPYLASMGIYLFHKSVLQEVLDNDFSDFGHHVIPDAVRQRRVQVHLFDGYWRDIGTIRSFYDAHMDLVKPNSAFDFYDLEWPFFTRPRYLPNSRLSGCRFNNSMLADGAIIDDSTIEDSIVGLRTTMRKATVRRTLIMGADDMPLTSPAGAPPIGIGEGSLIQDAIIDLNARIGRNVRIVNRGNETDAEGPGWVIRDGIVVVPKDAVVPDGTTI
ncbi:MAG TPA: glucose-1-phosphate adenylyltransferase [Candidatus Polarisedimenticolaceae bacterium]|nr:glucose-1-phosphate adenylyltransferase [Candidatus Polarisedimenticolaceae bacterium]